MRLNPSELLSRLNSSYWFVPSLVTLGGVGAALALLLLDSRVTLDPAGALALLRPSSPEGARALLSAVIGAMITAISVTFSVTIVALTVAAQHFGPRVLNNFVRHTSAQVVLGTFMATFVYAVMALGAVRGTGPGARIPELTVSGAVVLVVLSIGALIFYVHHVSSSLQIGELAAEIATDFGASVARLHAADSQGNKGSQVPIPPAPADAGTIPADETGYMQRISYGTIVRLAAERDAVVWIRREPGTFVLAGAPLALVHPAEACDRAFVRAVRGACVVGRDRTLWRDPEFALKQLVEVALRALSPGVNEPFTAMTCIDRLTEGLARVACAPAPFSSWLDAHGHARVFAEPQPFPVLLRAAFDPIRIFAGANPAVYVRLLDALADLSLIVTRSEDRSELRRLSGVIHRAARAAVSDDEDRTYLDARYEHALRQFDSGPSSTRQ